MKNKNPFYNTQPLDGSQYVYNILNADIGFY